MRTVLPVSRLQLVQGNRGIHRLQLRQVDSFLEGQPDGILFLRLQYGARQQKRNNGYIDLFHRNKCFIFP